MIINRRKFLSFFALILMPYFACKKILQKKLILKGNWLLKDTDI